MSVKAVLDPELNRCPDTLEHIHLIGICGTGMAALAGMLHSKGFTVTGSDQHVYPPMSDFLAGLNIPIMNGYSGENLDIAPDLVVVGNVVRPTNPEAVTLGEKKIPYLSMPQALGHFFLADSIPLVVAGTHGKTTTSSMLATTLHRMGETPGFMIGGIVEAFGRNFNIGDSSYFVVEGDEYDTAFFNKVSKFQHYRPQYVIITSIEFDHADIFCDLEAIKSAFRQFIARIPPSGGLIVHADDAVVQELAREAACPVLTYGTAEHAQWRIMDIAAHGMSTTFSLEFNGKFMEEFTLPMIGTHNALNATAVIALLHHLGFDLKRIGSGLSLFEGVMRRQQVRGREAGVTVIDDFAHHPTAVRETVRALREAWPENRLIIVFEPRTNTSRRKVFQEAYASAFEGADRVLVREHVPLDTVPPDQQFSSRQLVSDIKAFGVDAGYYPDTETIINEVVENAESGDVVAILSNGGFDNIHLRLLTQLRDFA